MKESYRKDLAGHPDPESCGGGRKAGAEALTGAHAGQPLSCEIKHFGVPTPLVDAEGNIGQDGIGESCPDPAQSKTLRMRENSLHGNRETPRMPTGKRPAGRSEKGYAQASDVHVRGESDGSIVPENLSNKGEGRWLDRSHPEAQPAERGEGRRPKETLTRRPRPGHRAGPSRRTDWRACEEGHAWTSVRGSPPCCTT